MKLVKALSVLAMSLFIVNVATADVINNADVNGLKTFKDTNTGRIWLDINNFFDAGANDHANGVEMLSIAQAAGFTMATKSDLADLLTPLALDAGQWAAYAAVMGHGAPRQLIWGMYDDGSSPYGWAYAFSSDAQWSFIDNAYDPTTKVNGENQASRDLGLWAYQVEATVPEPTSIALMTLGVAGLLAARRRKRQD